MARDRRIVQVQLPAQQGERFLRGIASQDARGDVAWQNFNDREDDSRDDEQRKQRQQDSPDQQP